MIRAVTANLAGTAVITTGLVLAAVMWLSDHRTAGPHIRHAARVLLNGPWGIINAAAWALGSTIAWQRHGRDTYHGRHRLEDKAATA